MIVVVTYNSGQHIDNLLRNIPAALGPQQGRVVVVDNGSVDDTRARVRLTSDVRLIESTNIGYAAGLNLGIRSCERSTYVLVVNPDCVLEPDSVSRLVEGLAQPGVGICVPVVRDGRGRRVDSLRREPTLLRAVGLNSTGHPLVSEYVKGEEAYTQASEADWALGAVMAFRRDLWDVLGGWDESFFLYAEETDFCLRARDRGWSTVLAPHANVTHFEGGSGRTPRTHSMLVVNRVRIYARRHRWLSGAAYWMATVASELTWLARGRRESAASVRALLRPATRPHELGPSATLVPR